MDKKTALAPKQQQSVTELAELVNFTPADFKRQFLPEATTEKEVLMAIGICESFSLNPFKREIHFIKYRNKKTGDYYPLQCIIGYEVYLKRAERTGKLDGWKAEIVGDKAICTIYRKDQSHPFVWETDRAEFSKKTAQTGEYESNNLWNKMENFLLKKVNIAQAFRLAFPDEFGGMPYTAEEAELINDGKHIEPVAPPAPVLPQKLNPGQPETKEPIQDAEPVNQGEPGTTEPAPETEPEPKTKLDKIAYINDKLLFIYHTKPNALLILKYITKQKITTWDRLNSATEQEVNDILTVVKDQYEKAKIQNTEEVMPF